MACRTSCEYLAGFINRCEIPLTCRGNPLWLPLVNLPEVKSKNRFRFNNEIKTSATVSISHNQVAHLNPLALTKARPALP